MINEYLHILLNLAAVLFLIFVSLFIIKKMKSSRYGTTKYINLIQIVPLGQKEKIILLEANHRFLLLGATANRIELLHTFEKMDISKQIASKDGFSDVMRQVYDKKKLDEKDTSSVC